MTEKLRRPGLSAIYTVLSRNRDQFLQIVAFLLLRRQQAVPCLAGFKELRSACTPGASGNRRRRPLAGGRLRVPVRPQLEPQVRLRPAR
jgi:hypothetical protein